MKGHPILGAISGFMFGLFLGISLFLWGFVPLHSQWLWILPLVGIVFGMVMAAWAPFGKSAEAASAPAADVPASPPPPSTTTQDATLEQDIVNDGDPPPASNG